MMSALRSPRPAVDIHVAVVAKAGVVCSENWVVVQFEFMVFGQSRLGLREADRWLLLPR